jgi:glycogen operon protein
MAVILMISQGVPMLVAGDEFGRSQQGNNNAWCQDNELSWLNWQLVGENREQFRFFKMLIALRRRHEIFRRCDFFDDAEQGQGITWHSSKPGEQDWSVKDSCLAFHLHGDNVHDSRDDDFFVMLNGSLTVKRFSAPALDPGRSWHLLVNSAAISPADIVSEEEAEELTSKDVQVKAMAAVILVSRPKGRKA